MSDFDKKKDDVPETIPKNEVSQSSPKDEALHVIPLVITQTAIFSAIQKAIIDTYNRSPKDYLPVPKISKREWEERDQYAFEKNYDTTNSQLCDIRWTLYNNVPWDGDYSNLYKFLEKHGYRKDKKMLHNVISEERRDVQWFHNNDFTQHSKEVVFQFRISRLQCIADPKHPTMWVVLVKVSNRDSTAINCHRVVFHASHGWMPFIVDTSEQVSNFHFRRAVDHIMMNVDLQASNTRKKLDKVTEEASATQKKLDKVTKELEQTQQLLAKSIKVWRWPFRSQTPHRW